MNKDTACFVHSLLEQQRKDGGGNAVLGQIAEDCTQDAKLDTGQASTQTDMHSRLLTKKQLSDMAWGVRELSKRLGGIRLKLRVQTVFILTKAHDETLIGYTREVTKWLLSQARETRYTVYVAQGGSVAWSPA